MFHIHYYIVMKSFIFEGILIVSIFYSINGL